MSDLDGEAYWRERAQQLQHALASRIVVEQEPVVRALARHAPVLTRGARDERIVQTEIFFCAINEEIAQLDGTTTMMYLCECGNPACAEGINLAPGVLGKLHASPGHFVVLAGHEIPDVESVVERADGYLIVRKNA